MKKIVLLVLLVITATPAFAQMKQDMLRQCQYCDIPRPEMGGMMGMGGH